VKLKQRVKTFLLTRRERDALRILHQGVSREVLSDSFLDRLHIEDYNPDRVLRWKGSTLKLYDQMMTDDKISGTFSLFKSLTLSADWEIKGGNAEHRKFVKSVMDHLQPISFLDVCHNLMDYKTYGFKVAENVWGYRNGKQVITATKCKHSHNIKFHADQYDNLEYFYVGWTNVPEKRFYPSRDPGKFLIAVYPYVKDGNWYGTSDLQAVYREWWAKDLILKFRNIYLQNFGMPVVLIVYDEEMPGTLRQNLFDSCANIQENFQLRIPARRMDDTGDLVPYAKIEFLEAKRPGDARYNEAISQLDTAMSRKLGIPDKIGFSDSPGGSYNLGQTQFEVILTNIKTEHARISDIWNEQWIIPLIVANYGEQEEYPKLHWLGLTEGLTESKSKILSLLKQAAIIDGTEKWIADYLGIPYNAKRKLALPAPKQPGEQPEGPPNEKPPFGMQKKDYWKRTDLQRVERELEDEDAKARGAWTKLYDQIGGEIVRRLEKKKILEGKNLDALEKPLYEPKLRWQMRKIYQTLIGRSYIAGRITAREEIADEAEKAGIKLQGVGERLGYPEMDLGNWLDYDWLKKWAAERGTKLKAADRKAVEEFARYALFITKEFNTDVLGEVRKLVYNNVGKVPGRTLARQIRTRIRDYGHSHVNTIISTNSSRAYNAGRMDEFAAAGDLIEAYQYVAILDPETTVYCREHDTQIISPANPAFGSVQPPNHYQCRSVFSPIFAGEEWEDNWNEGCTVCQPQKTFGA
jgi:SPP1 gp7 family putative phage head morphogenesis protein